MLERAYQKQGKKPIVYKVNPKAMQRQQLLGQMNMDTREWYGPPQDDSVRGLLALLDMRVAMVVPGRFRCSLESASRVRLGTLRPVARPSLVPWALGTALLCLACLSK